MSKASRLRFMADQILMGSTAYEYIKYLEDKFEVYPADQYPATDALVLLAIYENEDSMDTLIGNCMDEKYYTIDGKEVKHVVEWTNVPWLFGTKPRVKE
jgi:hypothetical protein